MPDFSEESVFPTGVAIIEATDLVIGGSEDSGPNKLAKPLVDRTRYLKTEQDALKALVQGLVNDSLDNTFNLVYPVGSVYVQTSDNRNPNQIFGGRGTWERYARGRMMIGDTEAGAFATAGSVGGNTTVSISDNQTGVHSHSLDASNTEHEHRYDRPVGLQQISYQPGPTAINVVTGINNDPTSREQVNVSVANNGQGADIPIMNPYIVVHMWRRTA